MTVGEKIKAARKAAGLTQKELAKKMEISYQNLAQWETGKRNPKISSLIKIASALEIPVSVLYGENLGYMSDEDAEIISLLNPEALNRVLKINLPSDGEITHTQAETGSGELKPAIVDRIHREKRLLDHFHQLNPQGQELAVEQVELVAKVPEYRADQDHEDKEKRPHT